MSGSKITIRRAYVTECERFWKEVPVKWRHNKLTNHKTLSTVEDAKAYLKSSSAAWELDLQDRKGRMFMNTLYSNCEQAGASASEYFTAQYVSGSQNGVCKYILVIVYNNSSKITVAYAYHDIEESLVGTKYVYTAQAEAITEHWLKAKSIESLKEILPAAALPAVTWE